MNQSPGLGGSTWITYTWEREQISRHCSFTISTVLDESQIEIQALVTILHNHRITGW